MAAVLLIDGRMLYCDKEPPQHLIDQFQSCDDAQIMSLELLYIALALSSFSELLCSKKLCGVERQLRS